ncbi:hypothetical protein ADK59_21450 [Streptomyces sp. XY332]|nr:hypothetical protein ADK59_21450 [Streptomyces sp. XY332]
MPGRQDHNLSLRAEFLGVEPGRRVERTVQQSHVGPAFPQESLLLGRTTQDEVDSDRAGFTRAAPSSCGNLLGRAPVHPRPIRRTLKAVLKGGDTFTQTRVHGGEHYGTTFFDELGLYRILGPGNDYRELETFVHEWLGQLIDYDSRHHTAMVETLSQYFDCGGNYDETAESLAIHCSTLRYRLQRIRNISANDLANVEDRLNLQVATRVWKIVLGEHG